MSEQRILVRAVAQQLREYDNVSSEADMFTRMQELEEIKAMCAAEQAHITVKLDTSRRAANPNIRADRRVRGLSVECALARRESPAKGNRLLGLALALIHEMPHTYRLLREGQLSEWRATILVRETACLSREDRGVVDSELCADPAVIEGTGDRRLAGMAKAIAVRLDAAAVVKRHRKALSERRVTCRPAPDEMVYLTALIPMKEGVSALATLMRDAAGTIATGDQRTRDQIMADILVARLTGAETAADTPVAVNLVISDETLLNGSGQPAVVSGYGPVPAVLARQFVARSSRATLRNVYANPKTGALTAMQSRSRCFPKGLAELIDIRDQTCRTPWCDAPIRHRDHIHRHEDGGETTIENGSGRCQNCNIAKEAALHEKPEPVAAGEPHRFTITTPTGHSYVSAAPALPRPISLSCSSEQSRLKLVGVRVDHRPHDHD